MFRNILVPTDGSELSRHTAAKAIAFARETGARITFFTALPDFPVSFSEGYGITDPGTRARLVASAEAQGRAGFHLIGEAGVVQPQLADGGAQVLEVGGVHREQAAEDHRLDFLEALQRFGGRLLLVGDGVADGGVGHFLDLGGDEADLAGAQLVHRSVLGQEDADFVKSTPAEIGLAAGEPARAGDVVGGKIEIA